MNSQIKSPPFSFDEAALTYDSDFTHSGTGLLQRQRVYTYLKNHLPAHGKNILEINCGTGEDAIWFSKNGYTVSATDISTGMIETAENKLKKEKKELPITFYPYAFDELKNKFKPETFDLIFSNFGGLNCVNADALKKLSADFSALLKPSGKLIMVIMGRKCLWEILYFLLKLKPAEAFRRLSKHGVSARVGNRIQQTFYYKPSELKTITECEFVLIEKRPIGIALPPSYLDPFFKNKTSFLSVLNTIENKFSMSFLSDLADHYFIVFKKIK